MLDHVELIVYLGREEGRMTFRIEFLVSNGFSEGKIRAQNKIT